MLRLLFVGFVVNPHGQTWIEIGDYSVSLLRCPHPVLTALFTAGVPLYYFVRPTQVTANKCFLKSQQTNILSNLLGKCRRLEWIQWILHATIIRRYSKCSMTLFDRLLSISCSLLSNTLWYCAVKGPIEKVNQFEKKWKWNIGRQ